jgi:hypothetical protein
MSRREEVLESCRVNPARAAEDSLKAEARWGQELAQVQGDLQQTQAGLAQTQADLAHARMDLQEAKAFIAELTRQLFGPKVGQAFPGAGGAIEGSGRRLAGRSRAPAPDQPAMLLRITLVGEIWGGFFHAGQGGVP